MLAFSSYSATRYNIVSSDDSLRSEVKKNLQLYLAEFRQPTFDNIDYWQKQLLHHAHESLQALGYYDSHIKVTIKREKNNTLITLDVEMGYPIVIRKSNYQITGAGKDFPAIINARHSFPLVVGSKLDHGSYATVKKTMTELANRYGFFDAKWLTHQAEVDLASQSATINLHFDTGQRYTFGAITLTDEHASNELVLAMAPFKQGEYFDSELVADYNIALNKSRYFTSVQAIPGLPNHLDHEVNVAVTAIQRPRNIVEVSAGVTSDLGERGRLKWVKPWINRYGHSLESEMKLNKQQQSIINKYKIPHGDPNKDYTNYVLGWQQSKNDKNISSRYKKYSLQWQRHQAINEEWKRILLLKYERENDDTQSKVRSHLIPGISYVRQRRLGGITPYWGDRQFMGLEISNKAWGSAESFYKLSLRSNWLRQYNDTHQLLIKLEAGYISADNISQVPISMRYFGGGDNNLRAYDFRSVSPLDKDNKARGALTQLLSTIEYSYPIKDKWRLAVFHDAGSIGDKFFDQQYSDAGVGIRYETPVGLIRLDFAQGLKHSDNSAFDKPFKISFAIGLDL